MIFWSTWGILPRSGLYFPPTCFRNFNWGGTSSCDPTHAAGSNDCILALMIFWSTWGILPRSGLYFPPNCFRNFNWGIRCASSCDPTHAAGSNDCILALWFFEEPEAFCTSTACIFHPIAFAISVEASAAPVPGPVGQPLQQPAASWLFHCLTSLSFSTQLFLIALAISFYIGVSHKNFLWASLCSSNQFCAHQTLLFFHHFTWGVSPSSSCERISHKSSCQPACGHGSCILDVGFLNAPYHVNDIGGQLVQI